ncbi:hypothetical protein HDF16_002266 [Granulicella aggregans]|uniref:DUF4259 domain-containing protein n=1 Tax=Granulicella aggregans TaxID=474949 RepID=A0A7W8E4U9_9BACT|nr:DUF4259 domain-containing protein [Granulicella aggregans]MBB5057560.1 hypothetical protein [Granulicella aggregans]
MSAWGTAIFENDDAADYAASIAEDSDLHQLERTLDRTLAVGSGDLEAQDGSEALAAADIVARLLGNWGIVDDYTANIDMWVKTVKLTPSAILVTKARDSVKRVETEPSELLELWAESDELTAWKSSVDKLAQRLL